MSKWTEQSKTEFIADLRAFTMGADLVERRVAIKFAKDNGYPDIAWFANGAAYRHDRGILRLTPSVTEGAQSTTPKTARAPKATSVKPKQKNLNVAALMPKTEENLIEQPTKRVFQQATMEKSNFGFVPEKDPTYVPFGFFKDLKVILGSQIFFPVYIAGLSGNGKTQMVKQVCAQLGREMIRVSIHRRSDESTLIGQQTLVDGNIVYQEGPVLAAMRQGAVLLLDEVDRGSDDLICLQGIMEGEPYTIPSTGETVYPKTGFNIVATANTKGYGSDSGRFSAAKILDDAFLERFRITVEQEYPSESEEVKILTRRAAQLGLSDQVSEVIQYLTRWAKIIRDTYQEGAIDQVVSTRRLVGIMETYAIFGDVKKAVELNIAKFEEDTKRAFRQLFDSIKPADENTTNPDAGKNSTSNSNEEEFD